MQYIIYSFNTVYIISTDLCLNMAAMQKAGHMCTFDGCKVMTQQLKYGRARLFCGIHEDGFCRSCGAEKHKGYHQCSDYADSAHQEWIAEQKYKLLKAENKRLKAENEALKAENEQLKAE